MLDQLLHFALQLLIIVSDVLQSDLLVCGQLLVQCDQSLNLLLFRLDHFLQTVNVVLEECNQTSLLVRCIVPQIVDLLLVEGCQLLDSAPVSIIVLFQFQSQFCFLSHHVAQFCLVLLSPSLGLPVQILDLCPLFFQLVGQSLHFRFMQVSHLLLVLLICSDEIILCVLVLCLDQVQFVRLLILDLLDLILQISDLAVQSLIVQLGFSLQILDLVILLIDLGSELLDVELLQLVVPVLRSLQILDLVHGLTLVPVLQCADLNLFQILQVLLLIVQSADL